MALRIIGDTKAGPLAIDEKGQIFIGRGQAKGLGGLGFDWDQFGKIIAPITAGVGTFLANKGAGSQPAYQPTAYQPSTGGAQFSATSSGLFGGIDTTTLLLIGGAILLFMSKR